MSDVATAAAGPVVLYELNEVPWRVVDWYARRRPRSHLAAVLRRSETFTTHTHDEGELSPWITWPTVHRSVYNTAHRIRFINQDRSCADAFPPIWEKLARAGRKVGVFGSLQSYPAPPDLPFSFYIPDTFAPGPETIPSRYACFQYVNLRQTQADGAIAKPIKLDAPLLLNAMRLFANGLTLKTALRLAAQLWNEKRASIYRNRRAILQAPVAFDVFRHALVRTNPDFCTFFTNHVAGIMHRYWKYSFPEDFDYRLDGEADAFHGESLMVALDYADEQIGYLRGYVDARQGRLYIASSMGQEAIHRGEAEDEIRIEQFERFVRGIGYERAFEGRLAMHPDFALEFKSANDTAEFLRVLQGLSDADGKPAFYNIDTAGNTVHFAIGCDPPLVGGSALYLSMGASKIKLPFDTIGIERMHRDVGTGYHQPEGILLRYGKGVTCSDTRQPIESIDIAPMIMIDLGLDPRLGKPHDLAREEPLSRHIAVG